LDPGVDDIGPGTDEGLLWGEFFMIGFEIIHNDLGPVDRRIVLRRLSCIAGALAQKRRASTHHRGREW
jgi:hypothetical protein